MSYELIHINVALAKFPLFSDEMKSFWDLEKPINEQAKSLPGFSREILLPDRFSVFPDPHILNATAWLEINALKHFVYSGTHAIALKSRKTWFAEISLPRYILFWQEKNHQVTERLAAERLSHYQKHGPTRHAFDFKTTFDKPKTGH